MSEAVTESSWVLSGILLPTSTMIIRAVSLFCLGMGIILSGPLVFLIILDIFIWIWRQCRTKTQHPATNHGTAHSTSAPPSPTKKRAHEEKANHGELQERI